MRTATVRQLRNEYTKLFAWIEAGEEITITRRGKVIARLVPEKLKQRRVDWSRSAALTMDKSKMRKLSAKETKALWDEMRAPY